MNVLLKPERSMPLVRLSQTVSSCQRVLQNLWSYCESPQHYSDKIREANVTGKVCCVEGPWLSWGKNNPLQLTLFVLCNPSDDSKLTLSLFFLNFSLPSDNTKTLLTQGRRSSKCKLIFLDSKLICFLVVSYKLYLKTTLA